MFETHFLFECISFFEPSARSPRLQSCWHATFAVQKFPENAVDVYKTCATCRNLVHMLHTEVLGA